MDENFAKELRLRYEGRALISVKQEAAEDEAEKAKTLEEHVLSVQELGKTLLEKNLEDAKLNPGLYESLFELIAAGRLEEAEALVLGRKDRKEKAEPTGKNEDLMNLVRKKPRTRGSGSLLEFT